MPAPVTDWEQVKATAIATGNLKDAADAHGIEYGAVRVRAHRENWPVGRRVIVQAKAAQAVMNEQIARANASQGKTVTPVTSTADALANALRDGANATRIGLTKYAARMAKQADERGSLEEAPLYKAVADIHGKMHPETSQTGPTLNLLVMGGLNAE